MVYTSGAGVRLDAKPEHRQDLTPRKELNQNPINEERFNTGKLTRSFAPTVQFRRSTTAMIVDPTAMAGNP